MYRQWTMVHLNLNSSSNNTFSFKKIHMLLVHCKIIYVCTCIYVYHFNLLSWKLHQSKGSSSIGWAGRWIWLYSFLLKCQSPIFLLYQSPIFIIISVTYFEKERKKWRNKGSKERKERKKKKEGWVNEWMNEWIHWMNEWMNEQTNEWMNGRMNT